MLPILRKSILPACGVLAALLFGMSTSARAQDTLTFVNSNGGKGVTIYAPKPGNSGFSEGTIAGDYNFILNYGTAKETKFVGFCTDIFGSIQNGESWTAKGGPTSINLRPDPSLYPGYANFAAVDYIAQNFTPKLGFDQSAAAQLAIWDILAGGSVSGSPGNYKWNMDRFHVTGDIYADQSGLAQVYAIEQAAFGHPASSGSTNWQPVTWPGGYGQPQSIVTASTGVPEPGAVALLSSLSVAGTLFAVWRRRRR